MIGKQVLRELKKQNPQCQAHLQETSRAFGDSWNAHPFFISYADQI